MSVVVDIFFTLIMQFYSLFEVLLDFANIEFYEMFNSCVCFFISRFLALSSNLES